MKRIASSLTLALSAVLLFSCASSSNPSVSSADSSSDLSSDGDFESRSPLLFSEFFLGESYKDRVVEIANYGDDPISLSSYSIRIYKSTALTPSFFIPLGDSILKAGETFTIAYQEIEGLSIDLVSDQLMNNGTWPMGLFKGEMRVDTLGEIGMANAFASDEVIIRKNEFHEGREKSVRYDWIGYPRGYSDNLHDSICPVSEEYLRQGPKLSEEEFALPFASSLGKGTGGVAEVSVSGYGDGDTTYFEYPSSMKEFYGHSFRYQNIDTPEVQHGNTIQVQPWGEAAAKWNNEQLRKAKHILVQSVLDGALTETYGRLLGFVWIADKDDPSPEDYRNLNYLTILNGYSKLAFSSDSCAMKSGEITYNSYFKDANAYGIKAGLKVFGEKDPDFNY